jgi:hypothetical protein
MEKQELNFNPELEIVKFGIVDIVSSSNLLEEDELPPWVIR